MEIPTPDCGSAGDVALPEKTNTKGRAKRPAEPLPQRKKLHHEVPSWVQQGERHFITINCKNRNGDELSSKAVNLLKSAEYYETIGRWYLWLLVIMPDHIHLIATFDLSSGLKNTIRAWKSYQTKTLGIEWQSDFFEHRLRNDSEFDEKLHYIRMNPVRKNLSVAPELWPHVLDRTSIDCGSFGGIALPEDADTNGKAKSPSEPSSHGLENPNNCGSAGGVALPDNLNITGRAERPAEPK